MRDIKFRGFAVAEMVNSQWLTGFGVYPIEFSKEYAKRTGRKKEMYLYTEGGTYQVQEKSIGQYTGLKDKNGVEIYEGDIVHGTQHFTTSPNVPFEILGEVKYLKLSTLFHIERIQSKRIFPTPLGQEIYTLEVIGNIYENKELLEVEENEL